jgi:hypothetical protein
MKRPIDPFGRKMIHGSFVYGGVMLVMFAVLTVVYLYTRPRCSDRVLAESLSPDKHWTATLMERRCGEEAPFFAHINLRPASEEIQRGLFSGKSTSGEVFLVEQDAAGAGLNLQWTAADTLRIQCPRCTASLLRKQEGQWNNLRLNYDLPPR